MNLLPILRTIRDSLKRFRGRGYRFNAPVSSDRLKEPVNKPLSRKIAALAMFAGDYSEVPLCGLTMDFLLHFLAMRAMWRKQWAVQGGFSPRGVELASLDAAIASS